MKHIFRTVIFSVLVAISSCAEDKGNYNYHNVNDIEITGIPSDTSVVNLEVLGITPVFTHSLSGNEEDLEYSWTVRGVEIATTRNLNFEIPTSYSAGRLDCLYTVTDTKTGMKFYRSFYVNVVSPFNWGYYLLCEKSDKTTVLSYFSTKEGNTEFLHPEGVGDYNFGTEPVGLSASFGNISSLGNYYWTFSVISKGGNNNVITTNNGAFMPSQIINSGNFLYDGYTFEPTGAVKLASGDQYYISNGGLIRFSAGLLYRPGYTSGYKWGHVNGYYGYVFAFDELTNRFYVVKPQLNDPANGLIRDNYALDRVVEIRDQPDLNGGKVLTSSLTYAATQRLDYVAASQGELKIVTLAYTDNQTTEPVLFEDGACTGVSTHTIADMDANSKIIAIGNDWYLATRNKIYTSPKLLPKFEDFVELPSDIGAPVAIAASCKLKYILIATYDPTSSAEKKGSFVEIEIVTKKITVHKNVIDKCVEIGAYNSDPSNWPFNFGDPK